MGVIDWFKGVMSGRLDADVPATFDQGEEQFCGLDMKHAIDLHLEWRSRLEAMVAGSAVPGLTAEIAGEDNRCALGEWLYSEGMARFAQLPEFGNLLAVHADFHLTAGHVLRECECGHRDEARALLSPDLQYKSERVCLALVQLYSVAQAVPAPD